ncbi:MAG: hypothetical protein GF311_23275 [Candidatus Lokiarchaeota archaeon]|nr:hypothetical protein [Candidatus Lokiarchaeota archaeon]
MKNQVICKECGEILDDKESGFYDCPQCQKKMKFYDFCFGCGCKPSELYDQILDDSKE